MGWALPEDCRITGDRYELGNKGPAIKADEDAKTY